MVSLEVIESLATLEDIEQYIELGKGILEDSKKALLTSVGCMIAYNTRVIHNWESIFFPALETQKEMILRSTRYCHGCEYSLCGQREHMGGCLPDYGEM